MWQTCLLLCLEPIGIFFSFCFWPIVFMCKDCGYRDRLDIGANEKLFWDRSCESPLQQELGSHETCITGGKGTAPSEGSGRSQPALRKREVRAIEVTTRTPHWSKLSHSLRNDKWEMKKWKVHLDAVTDLELPVLGSAEKWEHDITRVTHAREKNRSKSSCLCSAHNDDIKVSHEDILKTAFKTRNKKKAYSK